MTGRVDVKRLLDLVESCQEDGYVVVAFANYAYHEVLLNWLIAIDRLGLRNYAIISLDARLHGALSSRGIPSFAYQLQGGLDELWAKRIEVLRLLTENGINFVHSDVDAVWLRNPLPKYFADAQYDVVASQGTTWPPDVAKEWGFVLCCGLFSIRSATATRQLLKEVQDDILKTRDDQISLNRILATYNIEWDIGRVERYTMEHGEHQFVCSGEVISGRSHTNGIRVCLLPHDRFQRLHMPGRAAYVKHLLMPKSASSKLKGLRETGLLFLRPDWHGIDFDAKSLQAIGRSSAGRTQASQAPRLPAS